MTLEVVSESNAESTHNIDIYTAFFVFHSVILMDFNLWSAHILSICGLFLRVHV